MKKITKTYGHSLQEKTTRRLVDELIEWQNDMADRFDSRRHLEARISQLEADERCRRPKVDLDAFLEKQEECKHDWEQVGGYGGPSGQFTKWECPLCLLTATTQFDKEKGMSPKPTPPQSEKKYYGIHGDYYSEHDKCLICTDGVLKFSEKKEQWQPKTLDGLIMSIEREIALVREGVTNEEQARDRIQALLKGEDD